MEIVKEGTQVCLKQQIMSGKDDAEDITEDNILEYYLSVEYEVLKYNSLKTLLPVQLREKDGEKSLLFDITGKQPLKKQRSDRGFSQKECISLLERIITLLEEIDGYMLNLNYVQFQAEYIYMGADGEVQWAYTPQTFSEIPGKDKTEEQNPAGEDDFQKKIEAFFAWMLTRINYEDTEAVQLMYRLYNKVRKLGFSKEMLEKYIQSEKMMPESSDIKEKYDIDTKDRYDMNIVERCGVDTKERYGMNIVERCGVDTKERYDIDMKKRCDTDKRYYPEKQYDTDSGKDSGLRLSTVFLYSSIRIMSGVFLILAMGLEGIFIYSGIQEGFSENRFRYCIGGILLIAAFLFGMIWSNVKLRNIKIKNIKDRKTIKRKKAVKNTGDTRNTRERARIRGMEEIEETGGIEYTRAASLTSGMRTDVDWENEGTGTTGTTILGGDYTTSISNNVMCPMLQEVETGIVHVIKHCPFYIGSAAGVNQLEIQDKTVSREHAVILEDLQDGECRGYIIRDMNSTNGTWIHGKKMKKGSQEFLEEGEILRFAKKEYRFLLQDIR